jgi:hypothetical protein
MYNVEILTNFKSIGISDEKKQIILCHTGREVKEYLTSLNVRMSGNYDKIPNYIVERTGKIIKLLDDFEYTNYFSNQNINKRSIIISLENLGWLEKKPLTNEYINWKGNIYNGLVYEKKWRDYFIWQPYTDNQIEQLALLCLDLMDRIKIKRAVIGHNTKVEYVENFQGVVCRSNYDSKFTDLNPSFNFEKFVNYFENEQFA